MSRRALAAVMLALGAVACEPLEAERDLTLEVADLAAFEAFIETYQSEDDPEPFTAEPLLVTGEGLVRAAPDVAVITATLSAEDRNESRAVDGVSEAINAVQSALAGYDVEVGFTAVSTSPEYDEACLQANSAARAQHRRIQSDNRFNASILRQDKSRSLLRPARPRIAQQVCRAQTIEATLTAVFRVSPAEAAGDVLRAVSDAGGEEARLFGYTFADYDALYQQAASLAVERARDKAEAIARGAGGELGELVEFAVDAPSQRGRFGPQPRVIRPALPNAGERGTVMSRERRRQDRARAQQRKSRNAPPAPQSFTCPDGSVVTDIDYCPLRSSSSIAALSGGDFFPESSIVYDPELEVFTTENSQDVGLFDESFVVQEATTELVTVPPKFETIIENGRERRVVSQPARVIERAIPAIVQRSDGTPSSGGRSTNALAMSLQSGPRDIRVSATLAFDYDTPLTGVIIRLPETQ